MTKNDTCCCCISLRTGCLILTGFEMLVGFLFTILITLNWGGVTNSSFGVNNNYSRSSPTLQVGRIGLFILFTAFIITLLTGILGLVGTVKCKSWMLLVYLGMTSILMLGEFIGMVLAFVNQEWYNGVLALIALSLQAFFTWNISRYRHVIIAAQHAQNYSGVYVPEKGSREYNANPDL